MIRSTHEEEGRVLRLVLDRPKANILDGSMIAALRGALHTDVRADTALIVFEGEGRHFSFGASVEEHQADQARHMLHAFHGLFRDLDGLSVPTVAAVRGQCLGGGLELASWCTWIVASPDARLGQPEITLAVFPPMASVLLPWRIGGAGALDLCVSGRSISAEQALALGLVQAVDADPDGWWRRHFQTHLAPRSAPALRFAERAARTGLRAALDQHLPVVETLYLDGLMKTHDANEGIGAFLARRPPVFTHA